MGPSLHGREIQDNFDVSLKAHGIPFLHLDGDYHTFGAVLGAAMFFTGLPVRRSWRYSPTKIP